MSNALPGYFKILFHQDFYGIRDGQTVEFFGGVLTYPDGTRSGWYKNANDFICQNLSLNVEEVKS